MYLVVNILLHIYAKHEMPSATASNTSPLTNDPTTPHSLPAKHADEDADIELANGHAKGQTNGRFKENERRRMHDAQEFELDALISGSDSEDDKSREKGKGAGDLLGTRGEGSSRSSGSSNGEKRGKGRVLL